MNLNEARIKGLNKPCDHEIECFQVYKLEYETSILRKNLLETIIGLHLGTLKKRKIKRWLADCPVCGRLWFSSERKADILADIKAMGKKSAIIDCQDSIRKGEKKHDTNFN